MSMYSALGWGFIIASLFCSMLTFSTMSPAIGKLGMALGVIGVVFMALNLIALAGLL